MMNIKRLIFAVSAMITVLLVLIAYSVYQRFDLSNESEAASIEREVAQQVVKELRQSSDDLTTASRLYVETLDKRYEDYFKQILAIRNGNAPRPENYSNVYWDFVFANHTKPREDSDISVSLGELIKAAGFTDEEIAYYEESLKKSDDLAKTEVEAFNAVKGLYKGANGQYSKIGLPDQKLATDLLFNAKYANEKAAIMRPIASLTDSVTARTTTQAAFFENRLNTLNSYFFIFIAGLLVLTAVMGYLIYLSSQQKIAERQRAQEAAEKENEQLNDSVINILQAVSSLSERDLTARAPVTEDVIGTVSDSINLLADETAGVLKGVTNIAGQVSSVSDTVSAQAAQVSATAEEERKNVQAMIETLFDATQTMNQVAALAERSNESAAQATEVTENALATVNQTVGGMESIRETISETEKRIKRLGERSQEISGIVNLINTISERTHVLALNASMQAAVAGEAGRGFAVVAEEVQQLAESSRNATEQIATLVNNIQIETNETINTVNRTIGQVVEGSAQAQQAGEQMRKTQQITAELVSQVQNIAKASEQQKGMSAQLLEAVQAIGDSTEKTAAQIDEQNAGTAELQKAAKLLVDSVNVFKLPA